MRALFLVPWPSEAASTRLRVEQYFPYLRAHGVEPILRPFMTPRLYRFVYDPGNIRRKIGLVSLSAIKRARDLATAARSDVVFIHREAFPFGTRLIERFIDALGIPTILDFDDAIYLPASSAANGFIRRLKSPNKVRDLIRSSHAVVVGNQHLRRYASQFNPHVVVIPTPVDTRVYRPRPRPEPERIVVGWLGSGTTSRYLRAVREPLAQLLDKHPNVDLCIVGGRREDVDTLERTDVRIWSLEEEIELLQSFDIGLMPYPDNEWARGKCAFKALLYMSVGIPAVCSAVGMAEEVIQDGVNGYLARSSDDWFEILDRLVKDRAERIRVGGTGRASVERDFSLERHAPRLLSVLEAVSVGAPVPAFDVGRQPTVAAGSADGS